MILQGLKEFINFVLKPMEYALVEEEIYFLLKCPLYKHMRTDAGMF